MIIGFNIFFTSCTTSIMGHVCNNFINKNVLINTNDCNKKLIDLYPATGRYLLNNTNTSCIIKDDLVKLKNTCIIKQDSQLLIKKTLFINKQKNSICYTLKYLNKMTFIGSIIIILSMILNIFLIIQINKKNIQHRIYPSNNEVNLFEINLIDIV